MTVLSFVFLFIHNHHKEQQEGKVTLVLVRRIQFSNKIVPELFNPIQ
jgi:hypothetical protein